VVPEFLGKYLTNFKDGEINVECPEIIVNIALLTKRIFF
jgi:hypothetical protein